MTEHCDFEEQETTSEGTRPDMTVRLPGGAFIAVDAKAPLGAYLEAMEATEEAARDAALDRHVSAIRSHVRQLAGRDYASALEGGERGALDLVVMFLPGDPYLSVAFAREPELQTEALRARVLIATPTTLVALLRTVAIYWQQRAMAENAQAIADTARELYERGAKFAEDLGKLGRALSTALVAYNTAVGSFEGRFVPMARRLEAMKVTEHTKRRVESPPKVDDAPRDVQETFPFS
jgi:DNA recombination protein RmuC